MKNVLLRFKSRGGPPGAPGGGGGGGGAFVPVGVPEYFAVVEDGCFVVVQVGAYEDEVSGFLLVADVELREDDFELVGVEVTGEDVELVGRSGKGV